MYVCVRVCVREGGVCGLDCLGVGRLVCAVRNVCGVRCMVRGVCAFVCALLCVFVCDTLTNKRTKVIALSYPSNGIVSSPSERSLSSLLVIWSFVVVLLFGCLVGWFVV